MLRAILILQISFALSLFPDMGQCGTHTISVDSPESLENAISMVSSGTTIVVAPGSYGRLDVRNVSGAEGEPVIIRSVDKYNPPTFSGLDIFNTHYLVIENLIFDYKFSKKDKIHFQPFSVTSSKSITIRGSIFDGDLAKGVSISDDGFGFGYGLGVRASAGLTFEYNEVRKFHRALVVRESRDITIRGNEIYAIRSDGMNFAQVETVLIEENYIHDFQKSPNSADHADMIQFWTARTTSPSRGIVIRNNVLESGSGGWTQSIFIRNELIDQGRAGSSMLYRDILIEENVIINAHLHGISVGETIGLIIKNNTLVQNPASKGGKDDPNLWTPQIRISPAAIDVIVQNNVASGIFGYDNQSSWSVENNFNIQNRTRAINGFYGFVFEINMSEAKHKLFNFSYREGGPLKNMGIGASRLNTKFPKILAGRELFFLKFFQE